MMVRYATIEGKILDIETGELVEQDIIDRAQINLSNMGLRILKHNTW